MKYVNVDPLKVNHPEIELYRDGKMLTDVYNGCDLESLALSDGLLILKLKVVHEAGWQRVGTVFTLVFSSSSIHELKLEGGMDDFGQLESITILNESDGLVELQLASSVTLVFKCSSLELKGI